MNFRDSTRRNKWCQHRIEQNTQLPGDKAGAQAPTTVADGNDVVVGTRARAVQAGSRLDARFL
jgi:hypothetical protein